MTGPVRLSRGCWADADVAGDLPTRCAALLAVTGSDVVVTGYTAARIHGMWLPAREQKPQLATRTPGQPPRSMSRSRRPEVKAARRTIPDAHVELFQGLQITTPARTWVDLRLELALPDLVAAGDSVLRAGVPVDELADVLRGLSGRRHIRSAVRALGLLDARSRSRAETHLRVAARGPGLPPFEVNVAVHDEYGQWLAEPDLSCAAARLALEYQGEHHADVDRMRKDITRFGDLRRAGWLAISYGPAEVFGRPWQIAPELRAVLRDRAPHLVAAVHRAAPRVAT